MRIVKFTVIGLIGLIVVLAVGLVIAINTVDLARYQGLVADRVEAATGRALAIDGALDIGISLSPTLVAEGVRFANPPGSENPDMVRIARIEAQVLDTFVGGVSTVIGTLFSEQSEWTVVNCAAVSFALVDGIATSQVLLFDSDAATVAGRGTLDLSTEALDFVVTPQAKVATLNVSTPVLVGGTLADPSFAPDPLALARKVGGLLGIFVFPPAALLGLGELGHSENSCVQLAADPPPPPAPDDAAPALELPALPEGVGNAIEELGRGLQNLLGR